PPAAFSEALDRCYKADASLTPAQYPNTPSVKWSLPSSHHPRLSSLQSLYMPLYQLPPPPASHHNGTIPHLRMRIQGGSTCTLHTCRSFEPQPLRIISSEARRVGPGG